MLHVTPSASKAKGFHVVTVIFLTLALLGTINLNEQPLFTLNIPTENASISQTLMTTKIHWSSREEVTPTLEFAASCGALHARWADALLSGLGLQLLLTAFFVCSAVKLTRTFTRKEGNWGSGFIVFFGLFTLLVTLVSFKFVDTLYTIYADASMCRGQFGERLLNGSDTCDPFSGCRSSYKAMGFEKTWWFKLRVLVPIALIMTVTSECMSLLFAQRANNNSDSEQVVVSPDEEGLLSQSAEERQV